MAAGLQVSMTELLDTQQKIVDDLADKFAQIITLASSSGDGDDVTGQESAGRTLEINVETQGLIHAAEQYLSFNRKLKELWLFGQIRDIGEGEEEDVGDMESNSTKVREMVEQLIQSKNGRVSTAAKEAMNDVQNGGALKVLERTEEAAETLGALGTQGKGRKGDGDTEMGM